MRRPARPRRARAPDLTGKGVLFYDADCGFCRWCVAKVIAWDRNRAHRPDGDRDAGGGGAPRRRGARSAAGFLALSRSGRNRLFSRRRVRAAAADLARRLATRRSRRALSARSRAWLSPRRVQARRARNPRHGRCPSEGRSTPQRFFTQSAPMSVAPMTGSSTRQLTRPEKSSGRTGVEYTANGATSRSSFTASRR